MDQRIDYQESLTIPAMFRERVQRSSDQVAYRHFDVASKKWQDTTWQEMHVEVARWQEALQREDLAPGSKVAVMLRNSREWVVFDQAALGLGLVLVPLYIEDRAENIAYIIEHAEVRFLLLEGLRQWRELRPMVPELENLQKIVSVQSIDNEDDANDERLVNASDWLFGKTGEIVAAESAPQELASIVYTSGTTGRPKGVMLNHTNMLFNAHASIECATFSADDVFLSFLPLSHMLERTAGYYVPMMIGARVVYSRSVAKLGQDLVEQRPTVLVSVPRIYEKVYAKIMAGLEKQAAAKKRLFNWAISVGWQRYQHQQKRSAWHPKQLAWPLLKSLVASKVTDALGGRMNYAICGGAAMPPTIAKTFLALGVPIYQGYGMTESSPVVTVNTPASNIPESIGLALPGVEVKIGENDELMTRSPSVMLGYWKNEEATAANITTDGWLHSGDQARVDEQGHYYITGRIKDIIVLGNGEKLPPKDMEMAIVTDALFEQIMVVGEGRSVLAAVAVMDPDEWEKLLQGLDLSVDETGVTENKKVKKAVLARIAPRLASFPGYAKIRLVHIETEPWTVESGLMTPTLKKKRPKLLEKYTEAIDAMYSASRN